MSEKTRIIDGPDGRYRVNKESIHEGDNPFSGKIIEYFPDHPEPLPSIPSSEWPLPNESPQYLARGGDDVPLKKGDLLWVSWYVPFYCNDSMSRPGMFIRVDKPGSKTRGMNLRTFSRTDPSTYLIQRADPTEDA